MPSAPQLDPQAVPELVSAVRRAIVIVRYEWLGVRIGGQHASMKGLWPTLLVTAAVVFGCFFVIGRRGSGLTSGHEPSSALGALPRAAIPGGLRGGSPIVGSLPSRVAKHASSSGALAQSATAGGESSAAISARSLADASHTLASVSAPAAAVQTVPAEAPAPVTPSREYSSASGHPSNSGGGSHSPSSGGSFDRSE